MHDHAHSIGSARLLYHSTRYFYDANSGLQAW